MGVEGDPTPHRRDWSIASREHCGLAIGRIVLRMAERLNLRGRSQLMSCQWGRYVRIELPLFTSRAACA